MAAPSVTNSFSAGSAALASQVNTNFSEIVAGFTAGSTWDVVVNSLTTATATLTAATITTATITTANITTANITNGVLSGSFDVMDVTGATTLNGAVTLGDAAGDAVTVTGTMTVAEDATFTKDVGCATVTATGVIDSADGVSGKHFTADADSGSPTANRLFKANIPKAWAKLTCGAAGSVTVTNDFNITSASYAGDALNVVIETNMADGDYSVFVTMEGSSGTDRFGAVDVQGAGNFDVYQYDLSTGARTAWASGPIVHVLVFGDQ